MTSSPWHCGNALRANTSPMGTQPCHVTMLTRKISGEKKQQQDRSEAVLARAHGAVGDLAQLQMDHRT